MTLLARLAALALLPLAAACTDFDLNTALGGTPPEPEAPPPEVLAALPPGAQPNVAFRDGRGCWLYSVEVYDPPAGFPLTDARGNQICDAPAG